MIKKLHILNVALAVIAGSAVCMVFLNTPEKSYSSDQSVVHLYFADRENRFLIAEDRAVLHSDEPADLGRIIIKSKTTKTSFLRQYY